jgi:hypothetical protein
MNFDDVAAKFLDCAGYAKWPSQKSAAIVKMVAKLEDVKDLKTLTSLLSV